MLLAGSIGILSTITHLCKQTSTSLCGSSSVRGTTLNLNNRHNEEIETVHKSSSMDNVRAGVFCANCFGVGSKMKAATVKFKCHTCAAGWKVPPHVKLFLPSCLPHNQSSSTRAPLILRRAWALTTCQDANASTDDLQELYACLILLNKATL